MKNTEKKHAVNSENWPLHLLHSCRGPVPRWVGPWPLLQYNNNLDLGQDQKTPKLGGAPVLNNKADAGITVE